MHVERTFVVPVPVERVYDYLLDFSRTEQWDPGTVSTRRLEGDLGVGTRYANVSEFMGRKVELTYTTAVAERPRSLEFRGENRSSNSRDILDLRPVDEASTEIHYRAEFRFHGITRLLAPLVVPRRLPALADETVEQLTAALVRHA